MIRFILCLTITSLAVLEADPVDNDEPTPSEHPVPMNDETPADASGDQKVPSSDIRTYTGQALSELDRSNLDRMQQQLPGLMKEHHVPGVSFALISNRKLVWSRGYGVRCADKDDMVEPDTIMEACSMSKPFFAYLCLHLVEQQKFDLERPLVEYLGKDYLPDDPRHRLITAKMTLSHTSGLPNWRPGGWRSGNPLSLEHDPGSTFEYSGEGILMLQRSVEKQLAADLTSLSQKMLIEPLELKHTSFIWEDRLADSSACGHDREGKPKTPRGYYKEPNAAYTLYTTAEDYARFLVEILKEDRTAAHSISAETRTRMLSPISHREDQNADWGLGWRIMQVNGLQQISHTGANGSGFRCYSEFFPESGDGLVIMTNALDGDELWKAVIEQWHSKPAQER